MEPRPLHRGSVRLDRAKLRVGIVLAVHTQSGLSLEWQIIFGRPQHGILILELHVAPKDPTP
eukprot:6184677-Pyramimonas_sp.AAC.1